MSQLIASLEGSLLKNLASGSTGPSNKKVEKLLTENKHQHFGVAQSKSRSKFNPQSAEATKDQSDLKDAFQPQRYCRSSQKKSDPKSQGRYAQSLHAIKAIWCAVIMNKDFANLDFLRKSMNN